MIRVQLVYAVRHGLVSAIRECFCNLTGSVKAHGEDIITSIFPEAGTCLSESVRECVQLVIQALPAPIDLPALISLANLEDASLLRIITGEQVGQSGWIKLYESVSRENPDSPIIPVILNEFLPGIAHHVVITITALPEHLKLIQHRPVNPGLYVLATQAGKNKIQLVIGLAEQGCPIEPEFLSNPEYREYTKSLWDLFSSSKPKLESP